MLQPVRLRKLRMETATGDVKRHTKKPLSLSVRGRPANGYRDLAQGFGLLPGNARPFQALRIPQGIECGCERHGFLQEHITQV